MTTDSMSDHELLEFIPEPFARGLAAWLHAGHTGSIVFTVVKGRIVDMELVEDVGTRDRMGALLRVAPGPLKSR